MMKIVFAVSVLIACWAAQIQGDADVDAAWEHHQVKHTEIFKPQIMNQKF